MPTITGVVSRDLAVPDPVLMCAHARGQRYVHGRLVGCEMDSK